MTHDLRCCGTGTCLINADGLCWCGQRWDGDSMCAPDSESNQAQALLKQGQDAINTKASQPKEIRIR